LNDSKLNIAIRNLIEDNERLVQIAIVNSEEGEEQSAREIISFLASIFDLVYEFKNTNSEKYNHLIFRSIPFEGSLRQQFESQEDYYNQVPFIGTFRYGLFKIWKQGYLSNQYSTCQSLIFKVQNILTKLSNDSENEIAINEFFYLLKQILLFGIKNNGNDRYQTLVGPAYQVYFNVLLNSGNDPIKIEYLKYFDDYLWNSLRELANRNALNIFKSFVSTIFLGQYTSLITIRRAYEYFDYSSKHLKMITSLDRNIFLISNMKELESISASINDIVDRYGSDIIKDFTKEQVKSQLIDNAHRSYKVNNLKVYVYLIGAFLVFKKKFDWIGILWNYHQPGDADAVYGTNSILPEDLATVFHYLLKDFEYQDRIEFAWEEHHGITMYYNRYGLLLLARLPFVPIIYVFQDPLNISNLIQSVKSKDYDRLTNICKTLLIHTKIIDEAGLFPKHIKGNVKEDKILLRQRIENLLKDIIIQTEEAKTRSLEEQEISKEEFHQLLENVSVNFERENQLVEIFKSNGCAEFITDSNTSFEKVLHKIIRSKKDFISQWRDLGASTGYEVSRNLSYRLCSRLVQSLGEICPPKSQFKFAAGPFNDMINSLETNLAEFIEPIIIGFGFNFHQLLWNDENFKFSDGESQTKVGEYSYNKRPIRIYNVANWAMLSYFFVIDAKQFGNLKLFQFQNDDNQRGFISGKMMVENAGSIMLIFEYLAFFKIEFIDAPRILKVVVSE